MKVSIGTEEFTIERESKKAMDVEIIILNVLLYTVVLSYAFDYLSWLAFYPPFHLCYMRIFMGSHDRFHADHSKRWSGPIDFFAEQFALVVFPWAEPLDSIKDKHFTHHKFRRPGKTPNLDMLQDPHSVFEAGGFLRSLFSTMFFEEIQLYTDIRNKHITVSRWIRLAVFVPLQILFVMTFGWEKYLGVFFAIRFMSTIAWFLFSWLPHTTIYQFGFVKKIPGWVTFIWGVVNGKRVSDGFWVHSSHHAWPSVPSSKLVMLDEAVMRNPDAVPDMIKTPK